MTSSIATRIDLRDVIEGFQFSRATWRIGGIDQDVAHQ
jgi:hypothetical protein